MKETQPMDKHEATPQEAAAEQKPQAAKIDVKEGKDAAPQGKGIASRANVRIAAIVGGIIAIGLLGYVAGWAGSRIHSLHEGIKAPAITVHEGGFGGARGMIGMRDDFTNPTDGTTYTHVSGVVTQVNGNTFTIAGNGTTKTITTNDSTTFNTGSKKVSVNDSVTVRGTDSNGTFTANAVHVLN